MDYAGPLWLGKILDKQFCEAMAKENTNIALRSSARISKLLALEREEAEAPPTFYVIDKISAKLSLPVPPVDAVLKGIRHDGFQAVPTHFNSRGLRTNASAFKMQNLVSTLAGYSNRLHEL